MCSQATDGSCRLLHVYCQEGVREGLVHAPQSWQCVWMLKMLQICREQVGKARRLSVHRRECLIVTPSLHPHVRTVHGFLIKSIKKKHGDRMIQERHGYSLGRESGKIHRGPESEQSDKVYPRENGNGSREKGEPWMGVSSLCAF